MANNYKKVYWDSIKNKIKGKDLIQKNNSIYMKQKRNNSKYV